MFKLRTVADLTKTYIITSSKLKVAHFSIIALTICTTFAIIANIRAPVFLQILLFLLGGFLIYKINFKLMNNQKITTEEEQKYFEEMVRSVYLENYI